MGTCPTGETCQDGTCKTCLARQANCTTAAECCQDGGTVECAPIGTFFLNQCCRPLGGACSTPADFRECCGVGFPNPDASTVYCGPDNTCGGPGARCFAGIASPCVSGVCCGDDPIVGVCCAAGQQCQNGQCTG